MKAFKIARFAFDLEAFDTISLPAYKGSTFRGGFGHAFKKTACALKNQTCDSCLLKEKCVYSYIFETPPPSDSAIMRKYPRAPHPFVLEPPQDDRTLYAPGDRMNLGLTMIGKALDFLPYFIYSFDTFGQIGIGKGKGRFSLKSVRSSFPMIPKASRSKDIDTSSTLYDGETKKMKNTPLATTWEELMQKPLSTDRLTLCFQTPTRIRYNGHYTLELEFHILIRNLLRRISALSYFHCGESLEVDFRSLISRAKEVVTENRALHWFDWERYSGRQATRMKMGGFVGSISFQGDLEPFWPFVVLGQVIHVGKGTAFGLGRYEIIKS